MLKKLLENPVITLLLIFGVPLGFHLYSTKIMKPTYAISKAELIAKSIDSIPELKVLWKGKELKNIYSQHIVLFNNGRQYIDKSNISTTNPITISLPSNIEILFYKITKTSRSDLNFNLSKIEKELSTKLTATLEGDNSLEYKDGGVVSILYSGEPSKNIKVSGKIKGVHNLKRIEWFDIDPMQSSIRLSFIMWDVGSVIMLIIGLFFFGTGIEDPMTDAVVKFLLLSIGSNRLYSEILLYYFNLYWI